MGAGTLQKELENSQEGTIRVLSSKTMIQREKISKMSGDKLFLYGPEAMSLTFPSA